MGGKALDGGLWGQMLIEFVKENNGEGTEATEDRGERVLGMSMVSQASQVSQTSARSGVRSQREIEERSLTPWERVCKW